MASKRPNFNFSAGMQYMIGAFVIVFIGTCSGQAGPPAPAPAPPGCIWSATGEMICHAGPPPMSVPMVQHGPPVMAVPVPYPNDPALRAKYLPRLLGLVLDGAQPKPGRYQSSLPEPASDAADDEGDSYYEENLSQFYYKPDYYASPPNMYGAYPTTKKTGSTSTVSSTMLSSTPSTMTPYVVPFQGYPYPPYPYPLPPLYQDSQDEDYEPRPRRPYRRRYRRPKPSPQYEDNDTNPSYGRPPYGEPEREYDRPPYDDQRYDSGALPPVYTPPEMPPYQGGASKGGRCCGSG